MTAHATTRRRVLLGAAACAATASARSIAQSPPRAPLVGMLQSSARAVDPQHRAALESGLRALGTVDGRDIAVEYRYGNSNPEGIAAAAADLVRLQPDVLVAGNNAAALALKRLTDSIPIVIALSVDPVGAGLAASLARPGGNVTGLTTSAGTSIAGKRLQLLKEIVPGLQRVAVLRSPTEISAEMWSASERAAESLKLTLAVFDLRAPGDLDKAFAAIPAWQPGALLLTGAGQMASGMARICEFAARHRLPSVFGASEYAKAGLLFTYGISTSDNYRRVAGFVDRILRGARPADLPIEQPVKFEFVINMNTARAIGLKIPQSVLLRADEVIE
jgi:putative ABC transport system substrate-binding protein